MGTYMYVMKSLITTREIYFITVMINYRSIDLTDFTILFRCIYLMLCVMGGCNYLSTTYRVYSLYIINNK